MVWINTTSDTAKMIYFEAAWNFSTKKLMTYPVGGHYFFVEP